MQKNRSEIGRGEERKENVHTPTEPKKKGLARIITSRLLA
jgi:hypothetical protein